MFSGDRCEELTKGDAQGCNGKTIDVTGAMKKLKAAIFRRLKPNRISLLRLEIRLITMSKSLHRIATGL